MRLSSLMIGRAPQSGWERPVSKKYRLLFFGPLCSSTAVALSSIELTIVSQQDGSRLPYELIGLIAQYLQDEIVLEGFHSLLHTLANLNRVSRAVHEVTLPYLYHRTAYIRNRPFMASVHAHTIPRGWKYVKYVQSYTFRSP
jgi:hypothetical protein